MTLPKNFLHQTLSQLKRKYLIWTTNYCNSNRPIGIWTIIIYLLCGILELYWLYRLCKMLCIRIFMYQRHAQTTPNQPEAMPMPTQFLRTVSLFIFLSTALLDLRLLPLLEPPSSIFLLKLEIVFEMNEFYSAFHHYGKSTVLNIRFGYFTYEPFADLQTKTKNWCQYLIHHNPTK